MNLKRIDDFIWKLEKTENMRTDALIFASAKMIKDRQIYEALEQLMNVASLPGIVGYALAMPDIHWGYGFPIGGVAAFSVNEGIISPGGVGFDINCGVRVMKTDLTFDQVKDKIENLISEIYAEIPCGVGSTSNLKLSKKDFKQVLKYGAMWAVENGFGFEEDLDRIEDSGSIPFASDAVISSTAKERGKSELGTLGSGNHFIEIQKVETIFDEEVAEAFGLFENQIVYMIHTGSRGLGHQVATDYIQLIRNSLKEWNRNLKDKQLVNAPFKSTEGLNYFAAMSGAANYAFANRQIIGHKIRQIFWKIFGKNVNVELLYDVAHNIAKREVHIVEDKEIEVIVHRKGATRSFGPGRKELAKIYRDIGQPVIIPGSMGTASYILVGTDKALELSFGTTAHGAGRTLGRRQAKKNFSSQEIVEELKNKGIKLLAKTKRTIVEEAPQAYKDVNEVVEVVHKLGISKKVAKLVPIAVVKG